MARFCILAFLVVHLDCARIHRTNRTSETLVQVGDGFANDSASLGEVSASMESAGFQNNQRYLLKNVRSGRYLHVRSEHGCNGCPLFTVQSTSEGSMWTANTRQFRGKVMLTSVRSGNKLHVQSENQRSGRRVAHYRSTTDGSRWEVEHVRNQGCHEIVRLKSTRAHTYLHVDAHHMSDRDHVIHYNSRSQGSEWKLERRNGGCTVARESPLRARGHWQGLGFITSDGQSVTVGTTQTNSRETSSTFSSEISVAVSAGFDMLGASVETSVTATVGSSFTRASSSSFSTSRTSVRSFRAQPGGMHLWQWVFDYYRGSRKQGETNTEHFAQTAGAWAKPACLPGYSENPHSGATRCHGNQYRIRYN